MMRFSPPAWKSLWPPENAVAELRKRRQPRALLGLSLESRRLVVEVVRRPEAPGTAWSVELPFGAEAVLAEPDAAGAALAAALAAGGLRERRVAVCVPPSWALATSMDAPEMSAEDLRGFLELRAEREFPLAAADLRLGHCTLQAPGGQLRVTLAALPVKRLRALERLLEVAGCQAVSISLGLRRCLGETAPSAVHLLANCDHVDVVVTAGGGIAALRSIAVPAASEENFDVAGFCREVRITLGRLPEPLRRQVTEARFGGVRATAETLCRKTRAQFQRMGMEAATAEHEGEPAARAAAQRLLEGGSMPFEFVPPQTNRWETTLASLGQRRHQRLIGAGLGSLALLALIFGLRAHWVSSLEAEWEGMRRPVAELETVQQKIRQYRSWFNPAPEGLPVLETLVSAFPDGGEAWAKNIQLTEVGSKVTCTGFARNQAAFLALKERLRQHPGVVEVTVQQVRGENPVEFSLTFKAEARP